MQRNVLNHRLYRAHVQTTFRRVIALFSFQNIRAKTGLGIFGGTLLVGTGVVLATAPQNNNSTPSAPSAISNAAPTTEVIIPESRFLPSPSITENTSESSAQSSSAGANSNSNSAHVEVTVNGTHVSVPSNSSVHQTLTSNSGTTTVDVTTQSSGQNTTNSYTNVQTHSFSNGTTNISTNHSGFSN